MVVLPGLLPEGLLHRRLGLPVLEVREPSHPRLPHAALASVLALRPFPLFAALRVAPLLPFAPCPVILTRLRPVCVPARDARLYVPTDVLTRVPKGNTDEAGPLAVSPARDEPDGRAAGANDTPRQRAAHRHALEKVGSYSAPSSTTRTSTISSACMVLIARCGGQALYSHYDDLEFIRAEFLFELFGTELRDLHEVLAPPGAHQRAAQPARDRPGRARVLEAAHVREAHRVFEYTTAGRPSILPGDVLLKTEDEDVLQVHREAAVTRWSTCSGGRARHAAARTTTSTRSLCDRLPQGGAPDPTRSRSSKCTTASTYGEATTSRTTSTSTACATTSSSMSPIASTVK